jgi:hypothetical protein
MRKTSSSKKVNASQSKVDEHQADMIKSTTQTSRAHYQADWRIGRP